MIGKENTMDYKRMKLEDMMKYIEENVPQDKSWFKAIAFEDIKHKDGTVEKTYSHLKARKAFCERYMPEIIPVAKKKEKASDKLLNW